MPLCVRPGTFRLPQSPHHPLILVGPGTGVAPMRSVVLERRRQREGSQVPEAGGDGPDAASGGMAAATAATAPPPDTLFFGCRCVRRGKGGGDAVSMLVGGVHGERYLAKNWWLPPKCLDVILLLVIFLFFCSSGFERKTSSTKRIGRRCRRQETCLLRRHFRDQTRTEPAPAFTSSIGSASRCRPTGRGQGNVFFIFQGLG